MVKKLYFNGYKRALTLSFDDGVPQDIRLKRIFDKYGLKATFNIMGGNCKNPTYFIKKDGIALWDGSDELRDAYSGHEIASHSYTHKRIPESDDETCRFEVDEDIKELEKVFGKKPEGYAAPNGQTDERVISHLKRNSIYYNRLVRFNKTDKLDFKLPEDFYHWYPNPHFSYYNTENGKKLIEDFFNDDTEMPLFFIWGHSYEINILDAYGYERWNGLVDRWSYVDELCRKISGHGDTWYATNIEICKYVMAMNRAHYDDTYIDNPTDIPLFFEVNGKVITAPPHTRFTV